MTTPPDVAPDAGGSTLWGKLTPALFLFMFAFNIVNNLWFQGEQRGEWKKQDERERERRAEWEQQVKR